MFFMAPPLLAKILALCRHQHLCFALDVYVVVNFVLQVIFIFLLFQPH